MSEENQVQEFKLEPDSELRFELESKNEKVTLEVRFINIMKLLPRISLF